MKVMSLRIFIATVFFSPMLAIASEMDCRKFDHSRAYWIDEDGTPHWRMYSFDSDCKQVNIQDWHGAEKVGQPSTDQIDGKFRCLEHSGKVCSFAYKWHLEENKVISTTETISFAMNGSRQVKDTTTRGITLIQYEQLQELLTTNIFYKDKGEQDWFNAKTENSRCALSSSPDCQWNIKVRR